MMRKDKETIIIIFSALLLFFFRWTIIDNLFFLLTKLAKYKTSETYINRNLGFSAEYPINLPTIVEKDNRVSFGHEVPWINVSIWENENRLWQFVRNTEKRSNASLRYAAKWHIFYHPLLGCRGYSLNIIDNRLAICTSVPALAGAGGKSLPLFG